MPVLSDTALHRKQFVTPFFNSLTFKSLSDSDSLTTADGRNITVKYALSLCVAGLTAVACQVNELVELYKEYASVPIPVSAKITSKSNGNYRLRVKYGARDLDIIDKNSFAKFYSLAVDNGAINAVDECSDVIDDQE